jgi:hypothetical protein
LIKHFPKTLRKYLPKTFHSSVHLDTHLPENDTAFSGDADDDLLLMKMTISITMTLMKMIT